MGGFWLVVSVMIVVGGGLRASRLLAAGSPDRLWIAFGISTLILTASIIASSLFGALSAGGLLITQALVALLTLVIARRVRSPEPAFPRIDAVPRSGPEIALILVILTAFALSAWRQAITPVIGFDERMYHASRVAYWLEHRSVLPFTTHNERQIAFPWLGESYFLWPLVFTRIEWVGRMFFWSGFPIATLGIISITKAIGLPRIAALAAAAVFATTPTVLIHACALKVDMWLPAYLLGAAYFIMRASQTGAGRQWMRAGCFAALAISVKTTALALLPGVLVALWLGGSPGRSIRNGGALLAGFLVTAALSGFAVVVAGNLARGVGPLGSAPLVQIVQPEYSLNQVKTHAARLVVFLSEVPDFPSESLRAAFEARASRIAHGIGADAELPGERPNKWPGKYYLGIQGTAMKYSTGGLLWLPCLMVGLIASARQAVNSRAAPKLAGAPLLAVVQVPMLIGVVMCIRWMNMGPERFWIGAYALSVPVTAWCVGGLARKSRLACALAVVAIAATLFPSLRTEAGRLSFAVHSPPETEKLDEPYAEVVRALPPGSTILFFGADSTRDYPLFAPRLRFTNRVIPWGARPFDPARADRLVSDHHISHILIESDAVAEHAGGWGAIAAWLANRPDFGGVPLPTSAARLFIARDPPPAK